MRPVDLCGEMGVGFDGVLDRGLAALELQRELRHQPSARTLFNNLPALSGANIWTSVHILI